MPAEAGVRGTPSAPERERVSGEQAWRAGAAFSLAPAPRSLQALAQGLVEDGGGGGGDVEGVEAAPHRQADRGVAEVAGAEPQALLLAPEAENHLAGKVEPPWWLAGGVGAVGPETFLLEGFQGRRGVGDALDGEPLARAGGGLGDRRGDGRRASVADQDLTYSRSLADPQHGSQVARVLDVLEQDHQVGIGRAAELGKRHRRRRLRLAQPRPGLPALPLLRGHAVMGRAGDRRQGLLGDDGERDAVAAAEVFDLLPAAALPHGADQDPGHLVRPVPQRLADRMIAVEDHGGMALWTAPPQCSRICCSLCSKAVPISWM